VGLRLLSLLESSNGMWWLAFAPDGGRVQAELGREYEVAYWEG
jgi:hypothetical protein